MRAKVNLKVFKLKWIHKMVPILYKTVCVCARTMMVFAVIAFGKKGIHARSREGRESGRKGRRGEEDNDGDRRAWLEEYKHPALRTQSSRMKAKVKSKPCPIFSPSAPGDWPDGCVHYKGRPSIPKDAGAERGCQDAGPTRTS